MGSKHEGATHYVDSGNCYRKGDPQGKCVEMLSVCLFLDVVQSPVLLIKITMIISLFVVMQFPSDIFSGQDLGKALVFI